MIPVTSLFLLFAIASIEATPYMNVTENMIPRTYDGGPQGRIVNGVESQLFSRPYQASLQVFIHSVGRWFHICGAVILDHNLLVCASHCLVVFPVEDLRVEVGVLNLSQPPLEYTQYLDVASVVVHENYNNLPDVPFVNDIGLIVLKQRIEYNKNVKPIKIAPRGLSFVGEECVISGWGSTKYGSPGSPVLLEAKMRIWSYPKCLEFHHEGGVNVTKNQICILGDSVNGAPAPGACSGDSGGPLVCGTRRRYLLGVTSYGFIGCPTYYPNVYTNVPAYTNWINRNRPYESSEESRSREQ